VDGFTKYNLRKMAIHKLILNGNTMYMNPIYAKSKLFRGTTYLSVDELLMALDGAKMEEKKFFKSSYHAISSEVKIIYI